MATEAQRAPGEAREQTAASAVIAEYRRRAQAASDACKGIQAFEFNKHYPFCTSPGDLLVEALESADALCIALNLALNGDDEVPIRAVHIRRSIDGISMLLGLAGLAEEARSAAQ